MTAARDGALAAYRGMWQAFAAAGRIADPQHPDLSRYATGPALSALVTGIEANRRDGLVSEGDITLNPRVVGVAPAANPTEISISDCIDTSGAKRVRPSGPPFSDTPGGRRLVGATVRLVGGTWKVTDFGVREVGSC